MNSEQAKQIVDKMVNVQHFEQYLVKQYNECVVDLLLYGNNTFSLDLYLKLANSPMNNHNFFHKMAMRFCLENINVETNDIEDNVDYIPKQIEGYTHWAIDLDGGAFYYNFKPKSNDEEWMMSWNQSTDDCQKDDTFDSKMYCHQWEDNNWKNSLVCFEQKKYRPEPIKGFNYWAIDSNGLANYFISKPKIESETYHEWLYDLKLNPYNKVEHDADFDSELYRHQWEGDNWENSLVCFE